MIEIKHLYIFCLWIWILTILYWINISKFSMVYLSLIALIVTIHLNLFYFTINNYKKYTKKNLMIRFGIVIFELLILIINIYKHFIIDKRNLINKNDIIFSFLLFLLYNAFLKLLNLEFFSYYYDNKYIFSDIK